MKNTGFGAFIFPFVTVDDKNLKLKAPPKPTTYSHFRNAVINVKLTNFRVVVSDDGFVGVLFENKNEIISFLNLFFGIMLAYNNTPAKSVKNLEICKCLWDPKTKKIEIKEVKPSERNYLAFEREDDDRRKNRLSLFSRTMIRKQKMKHFLILTDLCYKEEFSSDLIYLVQGWDLIFEESNEVGFLYCWMLIESFIEQIWLKYIQNQERTSDEKSSLKSHTYWSTYHYIEVLSFIKSMDSKTRTLLTQLRKKRNGLVHKRKTVSRDDVLLCFGVALRMVINKLEKKQIFYKITS